MGAKTIVLYWGLCLVTAITQTICCFLRWHTTRVMMAVITLFRMESGLLTVKVDKGAKILCRILSVVGDKGFCKEMEEGIDLQEASQTWCAPTVMRVAAAPCDAFSAAYVTGMATLIVIITNIILMTVSSFLMYQYLEGSYKQRYRTYAMGIHAIGVTLMFAVIIVYGVYTMQKLDGIAGTGITGFAQATAAPGLSAGYILICVSLVVQIVALSLFPLMAKSQEMSEKDRILARENADTDELIERYGAMSQKRAQQGGVGSDSTWAPAMPVQGMMPMPQPMIQSQPLPPEGTPSRPAW